MEMNVFRVNFSDISKNYILRSNPLYHSPHTPVRRIMGSLKSKHQLIKLRSLTKKFKQGLSLRMKDSSEDGEIGLVTIENIKDTSLYIDSVSCYFSKEEVKKEDLLDSGDIITPRVRGIGNIALVQKGECLVPSENVLVIKLREKTLDTYNRKFLAYYLSYFGKAQLQILRTGGGAGSINQHLLGEVFIPVVDIEKQEELIKEIDPFEKEVEKLEKEICPLQETIGDVFVRFEVKSREEGETRTETFQTSFSRLGCRKFIRCGPRYRSFWDVLEGLLFRQGNPKYPIVRLLDLIEPYNKTILKKGVLSKEYILIELEDIESCTGRIINKDRIVSEIGSDKVVFGDSDLLVSKLRPYLGYAVLNDKSEDYIGSTELVPFKVKKEKAVPEYLKYLLLSRNFLEGSSYLMYGKEHPRIHQTDLLDIKVPCPDTKTQEEIVESIRKIDEKQLEIKNKIQVLRSKINGIIIKALT